jgi:hypothetical protein
VDSYYKNLDYLDKLIVQYHKRIIQAYVEANIIDDKEKDDLMRIIVYSRSLFSNAIYHYKIVLNELKSYKNENNKT